MRSDLDARPGDVNAVRGRTIAAAPLVEMPLRHLLSESGIDLERDGVRIVGIPGAHEPGVSSGVAAARRWKRERSMDFGPTQWGRRMPLLGRRQGGPRRAPRHRTEGGIPLHDAGTGDERPGRSSTTPRWSQPACVRSSRRNVALKKDVSLATVVGRKLFPAAEAELIADVVARDLPYYTPTITDEALAGLIRFAQATGLLKGSPSREQMVATQFSHLWEIVGHLTLARRGSLGDPVLRDPRRASRWCRGCVPDSLFRPHAEEHGSGKQAHKLPQARQR